MNCEFKLFHLLPSASKFWTTEIEKYGAAELWERILAKAYSNNRDMSEIDEKLKTLDFEKLWQELGVKDIGFISTADPDWPAAINSANPAPFALMYRGERSVFLNLEQSIAIVGTRNPTTYGERNAGEFAANFADHNWVVVSGGALGIDAAAHRGALIAEGESISVMAGGLNNLYPSANSKIFEKIMESGLIISEVPLAYNPHPSRFLTRNRLIAALARGTLVVEAASRSGSIRTALDASEYHRPVFAIPGPITSPASEGCHRLIVARVAELVTSAGEIRELISPISPKLGD